MNVTITRLIFIIFFTYISFSARADFKVVGPYSSLICDDYIFFSKCSFSAIDATTDKLGQLFELPESFKDVDEYKEKNGICNMAVSGI